MPHLFPHFSRAEGLSVVVVLVVVVDVVSGGVVRSLYTELNDGILKYSNNKLSRYMSYFCYQEREGLPIKIASSVIPMDLLTIKTPVPRVQREEDQVRPDCSFAPTQLALCLRFALLKGESWLRAVTLAQTPTPVLHNTSVVV